MSTEGRSGWFQRAPMRRLVLFLFWTALGLFFALKNAVIYVSRGEALRPVATLAFTMGGWYAWGLLAPIVLWTSRRYPLARGRWRRSLGVHAGVGVLLAPAHVALSAVMRVGALTLAGVFEKGQAAAYLSNLPEQLLTGSFDSFVTFWVIAGLAHALALYRRYRDRELAAAQLQERLTRAQLQALRAQLQPHFLFNTLNSISALVTEDPEAAERMIARLSELLRMTLEFAANREVTLAQELAFIDKYLAIEQVRYQDRLAVDVDVAGDAQHALVPALLLQPLVENAVRHGVAPMPSGGCIRIRAAKEGDVLHLAVHDNGPGVPADAAVREGVGLANTRARLQRQYDGEARFDYHHAATGFSVEIDLPFRAAHTPEPSSVS